MGPARDFIGARRLSYKEMRAKARDPPAQTAGRTDNNGRCDDDGFHSAKGSRYNDNRR